MKTSIILLTYNNIEYTKQCIESIRQYTKKDSYELIVVDNNSSDGTRDWLKDQNDIVIILNDKNLGFPKGCNQGIEIAKGDSILLLNNDTVVTANWLENLTTCLYSSKEIGAVGPVTNSSAYFQAIETKYNSIEEMQLFAREFNKINKDKYEERLKLIGFCMLIKKEVIDKVGFLDEIFTPGNYEDDDYSIRIKKAGYKLILCKNTFIHHYGGASFSITSEFKELLEKNEKKFLNKWGFTSRKNMRINKQLVSQIKEDLDKKIKVLEIGCGCGATLLYLKNTYKNAELYGVDINKNSLNIANHLNKVIEEDICNTEKIVSFYKDIDFDYIFISVNLTKKCDINNMLEKIKVLLVDGGTILINVKNPNYRNNINIKEAKNNLLMPEELIGMLSKTGYEDISGVKVKDEFDVKSYIISGVYKGNEFLEDSRMKNYLFNIENGINVEENINKMLQELSDGSLKINDVITSINLNTNEKCELFNVLGVKSYENQLYDFVLPLLQASFEVNESHKDTLTNLGLVLEAFGEYELSIFYLEKIDDKDDEVINIINDIKNKYIFPKEKIKQILKFLLRRVENNIETEESREEIYNLIIASQINGEDILDTVEKDIIKKDEVLNSIAVKFYEKEFYEEIIPLFQKSYDYNPHNFDTIYNLGYLLYELGEKEMALGYFEQIQGQNSEVDSFIIKLKGEI
ncbi:MAG: glycosyltransferase [Clostridiaceae bacterium]